jgi:uncharacterized protein (TIGR03435 family)
MRITTVLLALLVSSASAQSSPTQPTAAVAFALHPTGPLLSFETTTIKKAEVGGPRRGETVRAYIENAYAVSSFFQAPVLGGPAWIDTDKYVIYGKMPDAVQAAMKTMTVQQIGNQGRGMQQSLLADRFNLKVHFETREIPIYELTAANGGLKIKEVPPPPPVVPGSLPRSGAATMRNQGTVSIVNEQATTISALINVLTVWAQAGGKPIVDKTGFTGNFDIIDLEWDLAGPDGGGPALITAMEKNLGLKMTLTKGPVEVVVIDSIERPSEN